jgi:hypothetical protein
VRVIFLIMLLLLPSAALAEGSFQYPWSLKEGEVLLTSQQVNDHIIGQTLHLKNGATMQYQRDGGYLFHVSGLDSQGTYALSPHGFVCVLFPNGMTSCEVWAVSSEALTVVRADGTRLAIQSPDQ